MVNSFFVIWEPGNEVYSVISKAHSTNPLVRLPPKSKAHSCSIRLCSERDALYERLSNLEDESAAVKVSLIQLLQEKSATNKTLALENWRLNQRVS